MSDRPERSSRLPIIMFFVGLGVGAGAGLLFMWVVNNVVAAWVARTPGARVPHSGWGDVVCLALVFGIAMANGARVLASLYED